jgi:hypothetical protein
VERGYVDIDVHVEDGLFPEIRDKQRDLAEQGLRPERYTASFLAVAGRPEYLQRKVIGSDVWLGVEAQKPDADASIPEIDIDDALSEYGHASEGEDPSEILREVLQSENPTTVKASYEWPSNNVVPELGDIDQYRDDLLEFEKARNHHLVDQVTYFVTAQSEAPQLSEAVEQLENNGMLGVELVHSGESVLLGYEQSEEGEHFSQIERLSRKYDSRF